MRETAIVCPEMIKKKKWNSGAVRCEKDQGCDPESQ